ncbi:MAG: hypothetical protein Q8K70_03890 [Bacteroidota bacterium]|nr:hypothetical protein [Bacteroidota bacterium]
MKKTIFYILISVLVISCNKDRRITKDSITSAEDNSTLESEFSSLYTVMEDFASNDRRVRSGNFLLPSGAIITFQDSLFSDGNGIECTIDFGALRNSDPKGLFCNDGRFRAGILHIKTNKRFFQDSFICEMWAEENDAFYAGNDGFNLSNIRGKTTLVKLSNNSYTFEVENARLENEKGVCTWQSKRIITKKIDNGPGVIGDEFEITGEASGVNRKGEAFKVTVDKPLYKKIAMGCARTFVDGKISIINIDNDRKIEIDYNPYNNNACDLIAKAIIGRKEFIFTVR